MPKITISEQPKDVEVEKGGSAELKVKASVADGNTPTYQWWSTQKNELSGESAKTDTYKIPEVTDDHTDSYWVKVSSGTDSAESNKAKVVVKDKKDEAAAILLWDSGFASRSAKVLVLVTLVILWPVWILASKAISEKSPNVSTLIAMQLVIIGVAVAMIGAYVVLLEMRGRSRTLEELQPTGAGPKRYSLADIAKEFPAILKSFGELKTHAALLVTAIALFITAGAIAWKALPSNTGAPGTATPTPTLTASTSP